MRRPSTAHNGLTRAFRATANMALAIAILAATALLASPLAAQTVIGVLDGPATGNNGVSGAVGFTGWALADGGVRRVIVTVDGVDIQQARYGNVRPAVTVQNPGFPDSAAPGFSFTLNTTEFSNGLHHVSADVERMNGSRVRLNTISLLFVNNTSLLVPFGDIERPDRGALLFGNCDVDDPNRRFTVVEGHALDLGLGIGDSGVGFVELMLDGTILFNSRRDCFFNLALGGFNQCYGLPRFDIENRYPFALNAPGAGFRFIMDVGALITLGGRSEGQHDLSVRVGDISNQFADIETIPVNFVCTEGLGNEPSFGLIDSPLPGRIFTGTMRFEGWALDAQGVRRVEIRVDGNVVANTTLDPALTRDKVTAEFPGFPDSLNPVWRVFLDSNQFVDGIHQVQVVVIDNLLAETLIGEETFEVDNDFPLSSFRLK